ncbi:unnamed protein product [Linum tenue]|uniref:Uncharacterized protein n=1 Tax=Linum tenue TaxID=586396 RepID=A0AAV0MVZ7_9ROSI|nr:unnamed protein product [Linum tenue]
MERPSTITTLTTRRSKWKYTQPPPTPRILHLPRRPLRRKVAPPAAPAPSKPKVDRRGKLESLFDQEREFSRGALPILMVRDEVVGMEKRRERVEERDSTVTAAAAVVEDEKWRFQAEMLRAECNVLRMEKEIALKKVERRKVRMQRTLQSAVQTLLSGRERISNGENGTIELEEEILHLAEKIEKLQSRSSTRSKESNSNGAIKSSNFDKRIARIQEMAEASLSIRSTDADFVSQANCNVVQIEILRRKMERLSRGTLLERMEDEYGSMLSTASNSAASSASNSKRIELPKMSMASVRHPYKEKKTREEQQQQQQACTGSCKAIVRRVMEQVRAETEQWSQMQAMLGQVRDEMEGLQASRQFWEDRALEADSKLQSLHSSEQEWRQKAGCLEDRSKELEEQVSELQKEIERLKKETTRDNRAIGRRNLPLQTPSETEKRVLVCRMKENRHHEHQQFRLKDALREERRKSISTGIGGGGLKRSPFKDVGNSVPLPLPKQPLWL